MILPRATLVEITQHTLSTQGYIIISSQNTALKVGDVIDGIKGLEGQPFLLIARATRQELCDQIATVRKAYPWLNPGPVPDYPVYFRGITE